MKNQQRWAIVGAIWVAAIGIFLSAFKGRYQHLPPMGDNHPARFDTWTGITYDRDFITGRWEVVVFEAPKE